MLLVYCVVFCAIGEQTYMLNFVLYWYLLDFLLCSTVVTASDLSLIYAGLLVICSCSHCTSDLSLMYAGLLVACSYSYCTNNVSLIYAELLVICALVTVRVTCHWYMLDFLLCAAVVTVRVTCHWYMLDFLLCAAVVTVQVTVTGINYSPPSFSNMVYNLTINEGQPLYTNLLNITATVDPSGNYVYNLQFTS